MYHFMAFLSSVNGCTLYIGRHTCLSTLIRFFKNRTFTARKKNAIRTWSQATGCAHPGRRNGAVSYKLMEEDVGDDFLRNNPTVSLISVTLPPRGEPRAWSILRKKPDEIRGGL